MRSRCSRSEGSMEESSESVRGFERSRTARRTSRACLIQNEVPSDSQDWMERT